MFFSKKAMDDIINYCIYFVWMVIYYIQSGDIFVDARQIDRICEVLPQSIVQLLDQEPLGLHRCTAFLVLLSCVILVTLSSLSACVKNKCMDKPEIEEFKQELATQKRMLKLKDKELKKMKQELRLTQEDALLRQSSLLSNLKDIEDNTVAHQIKKAEIASLKEKLEEANNLLNKEVETFQEMKNENERLQTQIFELETQQKVENGNHQKKVAENGCQFQSQIDDMERMNQKEFEEQQKMQSKIAEENDNLQKQVFELEQRLKKSKEEESYEQMCKTLENEEREYRRRVCEYQMKEHKQWLASREMTRKLNAEKREGAKFRQMLTDLHRKIEMGQVEIYLSRRKKRHVYFNDEPEVFTFDTQEPAHKPTELPSPPDYWSETVQLPGNTLIV